MRIAMLVRRRGFGERLDDELQFHLEQQIAENEANGMDPDEARYAALRAFGNPVAWRDEVRATWSWNWLELCWRDIRYGVRTLGRTPAFFVIAVVVMALCIGASTALFTVVRSVLLTPLPFREPDRLVMIYERYRTDQSPDDYHVASPGDFYDWREQTHGFEDMAAWEAWSRYNLSGERADLPEVVHAGAGSANFFPLLGVQAVLGRTFTEADDHWGADTVVLTWSLFERRFHADPSIVGRQIHLDARPYTVIGVLPRSFTYPDANVQLWVPYQAVTPPPYLHHHAYRQTRVVARLRPDVSLTTALSQVNLVQEQLHRQNADQNVGTGVTSRTLNDDLARDVKKPLTLLLGAVTCLLLIGCLNVANLLVACGTARQKEVAIRGALGARRLALIREQLTESLLICGVGGATGVLLSLAATKWLASAWTNLPSATAAHVDGAVLAFACGLVGIATLLAGLLPAILSTGHAALPMLQASSRAVGGSPSRTAVRKGLLTVEIGVTVVLLIAAGLLLKNFLRLRTTALGCATDNVLTMTYTLPTQTYDTPEKVTAFHERLLDRVAAMPGVRAVGLGETVPGTGEVEHDIFTIPEHPPQRAGDLLDALIRRADPGYFDALQIPLLNGRVFTRQDVSDRAHPRRGQQVIVNHEFVRRHFAGEEAIGKHVAIPLWSDAQYEIVGVVGDAGAAADRGARSGTAGLAGPDHAPHCRRLAGQSQLRGHHGAGLCRAVVGAGRRGPVRRPCLPDDAANQGARYPPGAGSAARAGASPDAVRWSAPGAVRAGLGHRREPRSHLGHPIHALWNHAARSDGVRRRRHHADRRSDTGLPHPGLARLTTGPPARAPRRIARPVDHWILSRSLLPVLTFQTSNSYCANLSFVNGSSSRMRSNASRGSSSGTRNKKAPPTCGSKGPEAISSPRFFKSSR